MKKKIKIINAEWNKNEELVLHVEEGVSILEMKPMGQMLVDSDQLAFIYVVDKDDEYTYISIPESTWPKLKNALENCTAIYITDQNEQLLLTDFHEELSYLIENIKGNSNYGEVMVEKVEALFV
ncbi:hypothetical protein ACFFHH_17835 [Cytobacillus solani]|uniref:UPF0738 family protein n=1 Tax=Cytobacillus solani TaxID=1637975 RepID=UPI0006ABC167|nr:hypothetical protein [Cytobacillus solani]KOP81754.1 hypothetical protein AMS60_04205 [Bacillus sp. FJAT-21945]